MATSASIRRGQFPVLCHLCETEKKISWKCLDCDLLICDSCRDGRHLKIKNAKNHKVIDIKEIGFQPSQMDFRSIPCSEHKGQSCVMYCKSCGKLVCPLCMAKVHNGHQFLEISEGYEIRIQQLKDKQNQMKIKSKAKVENNMKEIQKAENEKYMEVKKKIKAQNLALKKSIDQHTEELLKDVDQRWKTFNNTIEKEENRMKVIHNTNTQQLLDDLINSNDAEKSFHMIKELEKNLQEAEDSKEIKFTSMPIFIPEKITQFNIGSLRSTIDIKIIRLVQEYTTEISQVYNISPSVDQDVDSMWICRADIVQKVKPETNTLKTLASHDIRVWGIAITPSNDLLLVSDGSVIKQISGRTGQLENSVYRTESFQPTAIHVTRDYKVLIGVYSGQSDFPVTGRRAVISMDKNGKNKTFYEHDIYSKSIFSYPQKITNTLTGNICVVDQLSSDYRGRVVVLSQEGGVITVYTGHSTISKPFQPVYIQITPADNIIVQDWNKNILHILNNAGHI